MTIDSATLNDPFSGYFAWAEGVHCAIAWDRPVLLNVQKGKYFALSGAAADCVRRLLRQGAGDRVELGQLEVTLWRKLISRGLAQVCEEPRLESDSRQPGELRSAFSSWKTYSENVPPEDVAAYAVAYVSTFCRLRLRGLSACVAHVAQPRRRSNLQAVNYEELARRYNSVRLLLSRRRQQCLIDSLVAFEFFAGRGVVGEVVLGVRPAPVVAHAWLEANGVVLNDYAEVVERYAEILRV